MHDRKQPRSQVAPRAPEIELVPGALQRVLNQIVRDIAVADERAGIAPQTGNVLDDRTAVHLLGAHSNAPQVFTGTLHPRRESGKRRDYPAWNANFSHSFPAKKKQTCDTNAPTDAFIPLLWFRRARLPRHVNTGRTPVIP